MLQLSEGLPLLTAVMEARESYSWSRATVRAAPRASEQQNPASIWHYLVLQRDRAGS